MTEISFVIPTLNAQLGLDSCLKSIRHQDYPQNQIEIIISDGGSKDNTLKIAHEYKCRIIFNPLKTAEAGKAVGIKKATGKFIALVDSDNILPNQSWLTKMLNPFKNSSIQLSEPWSFTYRKNSGFIERYSSLIGANDPYAFVCGIYDRYSTLTNNWTSLNIYQKDHKNYILVKLENNKIIPTIGANGTIYRRTFLERLNIDNYLFDIDLIQKYINQNQYIYLAKVKIGMIHTYCESSIKKFVRKQNRRLIDFYYYKKIRKFNWSKSNNTCIPKFIIYTLLIFPSLFDSLKGYFKKPDPAWFFHPLACLLTLYSYSLVTIKKCLGLLKPVNRNLWKQ